MMADQPMNVEHVFETLVAIVLAMLGAVVWFVRLEGRVNLIERVVTDWIAERKEVMQQVLTHMDRIECKVDKIALRCAAAQHIFGGITSSEDEK